MDVYQSSMAFGTVHCCRDTDLLTRDMIYIMPMKILYALNDSSDTAIWYTHSHCISKRLIVTVQPRDPYSISSDLSREIPPDSKLLPAFLVLYHQTLFVSQMQQTNEAVTSADILHGLFGVDGL